MTLLRRVLRTARPVVETLLAGALLGVVVTGMAGQLVVNGRSGASAEVPTARAFMVALIRNDLDTLSQIGPSADTLSLAINFQKRADALKNLKVDTLTYLGGSALGSVGIHVYAVETEDASGMHLLPFALTVYQGRVVRVEAP
jgi:hypothetical protein